MKIQRDLWKNFGVIGEASIISSMGKSITLVRSNQFLLSFKKLRLVMGRNGIDLVKRIMAMENIRRIIYI